MMKDRRRSVGKGIINQIAKLKEPEKPTKTQESFVCFLDPLCAVQKELSPWAFEPIFTKPVKGKLISKIDDEKVCISKKYIIKNNVNSNQNHI